MRQEGLIREPKRELCHVQQFSQALERGLAGSGGGALLLVAVGCFRYEHLAASAADGAESCASRGLCPIHGDHAGGARFSQADDEQLLEVVGSRLPAMRGFLRGESAESERLHPGCGIVGADQSQR